MIPEPGPHLSDGVVTLRPPDEGDLTAIDIALRDPDVVRWLGTWDSAALVLDLNRRRWAEGSPTFAICEADMRCVGHVWVNTRPEENSVGSVGYWLLPTARRRGLATRAVRLISQWAFDALRITLLRLYAEPANEPSQRVAERCGFRRIGIVSRDGQVHDRPVDYIQFELTLEHEGAIANQLT